ncbi:hypothetical protein Tco_0172721 [Tanacetum coccineum]
MAKEMKVQQNLAKGPAKHARGRFGAPRRKGHENTMRILLNHQFYRIWGLHDDLRIARFGHAKMGTLILGELDHLRCDLQRAIVKPMMDCQRSLLYRTPLIPHVREGRGVDGQGRIKCSRWCERVCGKPSFAQAEMDCHKLVWEFIPAFVKKLHTSVEYHKSLAAPISLCFTVGWLGGLSLGKNEEEIAAMLSETSDLDYD